jgi:hypothetical protein
VCVCVCLRMPVQVERSKIAQGCVPLRKCKTGVESPGVRSSAVRGARCGRRAQSKKERKLSAATKTKYLLNGKAWLDYKRQQQRNGWGPSCTGQSKARGGKSWLRERDRGYNAAHSRRGQAAGWNQ